MAKKITPTRNHFVSLEIEITASSPADAAQGFFEGLRPQFPCIVEVRDEHQELLGHFQVEFDDDGNVKQPPESTVEVATG